MVKSFEIFGFQWKVPTMVIVLLTTFVFSFFLFGCLEFLSPQTQEKSQAAIIINETIDNQSTTSEGSFVTEGETESNESQTISEIEKKIPVSREYVILIKNCKYNPSEISADNGDNIKIIVRNDDSVIHGFKIEEYNIEKIVNPGESVAIEFIANKTGTFNYYSQIYSITCPAFGNGKLMIQS